MRTTISVNEQRFRDNLNAVKLFFTVNKRFPNALSADKHERTLASWARRNKENEELKIWVQALTLCSKIIRDNKPAKFKKMKKKPKKRDVQRASREARISQLQK